ncbi:MAG: transglycosylase SLT domain-containing protein [Mycobacterium sp.]|uniref:transglycosylase SLT domain-containing protein n=1 Tax=Mycobacterium sp. TaxID=1785 RepID=UPI0026141FEF|nr:transglycosylase SLT domain-containing protein [Mycobacterium sp.]MDI3313213.1 transglycosylase SLT domain-containing protein [Mycobacterium sp.]
MLIRGHNLYGDGGLDGPLVDAAQVRRQADRLIRVTTREGIGAAAPAISRAAVQLRHAADADFELAAALSKAHADHTLGRVATRAVLDDAYADTMPATDTPLGWREAVRRMAARLRAQHRQIRRSQRRSQLLARRLAGLAYPHRRVSRARHAPAARAIPLDSVRYQKSSVPGSVSKHIAVALDRLGILDPRARRNWLRGYETLIARESGGRPFAVGSAPATTPGPIQYDGHGVGYARGLTQTIPATFARYHQPGTSTNIYDPVANICASINYVMHRYGVSRDGENLVALVQQADPRRPPKGY